MPNSKDILDNSSNTPFTYIEFVKPPNSFGLSDTTFKDVNIPFYRKWLDELVTWKCEKSTDNVHWVNTDSCLNVKKEWITKTTSEDDIREVEKHTLTITSNEEAYYRVLLRTDKEKQLISFVEKENKYELKFKVGDETEFYNINYDWDDFKSSSEYNKASISKQVTSDISNKKSLEWDVYTTVKVGKGEKFIVDPTFGNIVIETYGTDNIEDNPCGTRFTCAGSGTVDNITAYIVGINTVPEHSGCKIKSAIYDESKNLLGSSQEKDVGWGDNGWIEFTFITGPSVSSESKYWLLTWADSFCEMRKSDWNAGYITRMNTGSGDVYGNWPETWSGGIEYDNYRHSIYCDYSEPSPPPTGEDMTITGNMGMTGNITCTKD